MFVAILFVFTIFAGQLLRIQAFDASATQEAALFKRSVKTITPAMRGQILDTNGQVLADSVERFTIAADPTIIPRVRREGRRRAHQGRRHPCCGRPRTPAPDVAGATLTDALHPLEHPLRRGQEEVNPAIYREIRALGIPGISGERTAQRIYPTSMALGQLVGFVRPSDQSGAGGIEQMLDTALKGTPGVSVAERARDGYIIPGSAAGRHRRSPTGATSS